MLEIWALGVLITILCSVILVLFMLGAGGNNGNDD